MIGLFDSGLGGLTVLTAIREQQPDVDVLYLADQAYSPYGSLSQQTVVERCRRISHWLIEQGATLIVVACNTATALAIETLRHEFDVPFVGIEPGIKPAAMKSTTGEVAILATENTLVSKRFASLLHAYLPKMIVHSIGCVGLADAIETEPALAHAILHEHISPLTKTGIDHLVLGCTHYPLLQKDIEQYFDGRVMVIDTGAAVAFEVVRVYQTLTTIEQSSLPKVQLMLYSTQSNNRMAELFSHYESLHWLKGTRVSYQLI